MKLLVVLLCLASERYLMHKVSFSRFYWFESYARWMESQPSLQSIINIPWLFLAILILPFMLIAGLVCWLIAGVFYGILTLLFHLVIFYYCIGPDNPFYPDATDTDQPNQINRYMVAVNRQLFSTVFWYVIAGPLGALFHRLITLCIPIASVSKEAGLLADILEWLPARLMALLALLTGNFQRGIKPFQQLFLSGVSENDRFIASTVTEALCTDTQDSVTMIHAENMVVQSLVVLLVVLALCTTVAWM